MCKQEVLAYAGGVAASYYDGGLQDFDFDELLDDVCAYFGVFPYTDEAYSIEEWLYQLQPEYVL